MFSTPSISHRKCPASWLGRGSLDVAIHDIVQVNSPARAFMLVWNVFQSDSS